MSDESCGKTDLYRHFDEAGTLLYVGISMNAFNRFSAHKNQSQWASLVSTVKIEQFSSRKEALAAEQLAIKTEMPLHNIKRTSGRTAQLNIRLTPQTKDAFMRASMLFPSTEEFVAHLLDLLE